MARSRSHRPLAVVVSRVSMQQQQQGYYPAASGPMYGYGYGAGYGPMYGAGYGPTYGYAPMFRMPNQPEPVPPPVVAPPEPAPTPTCCLDRATSTLVCDPPVAPHGASVQVVSETEDG